jgi:hypothetical protein
LNVIENISKPYYAKKCHKCYRKIRVLALASTKLQDIENGFEKRTLFVLLDLAGALPRPQIPNVVHHFLG